MTDPARPLPQTSTEPQADPVAAWVSSHLRELNMHRGKVLVLHPTRGILASCASWEEAVAVGPALNDDGEAVLWPVRDDWQAA